MESLYNKYLTLQISLLLHGLLKNTAGYVTLERKNYQADGVKHFSKIDDAFTY